MKIYDSIGTELTYHNNGTSWRGILRGTTDEIELAFNGLYNFCATDGQIQYCDRDKTIAVFWTSRSQIRRYWFNRYLFPRLPASCWPDGKLVRQAMKYALEKLKYMAANSHEMFFEFQQTYDMPVYHVGTINAERPDLDFRDCAWQSAFRDKSDRIKKSIDTDI